MCKSQAWQQQLDRVHAANKYEADNGAKTAHLRTRHRVVRVVGQAGIIDRSHQRLCAEKFCQGTGAALLLTHTQHQGFHTANDHVSRERIEGGTVDFTVMPNLGHQGFTAADQADRIRHHDH